MSTPGALERLWLQWSIERQEEPVDSLRYGVLDDCTKRAESIRHTLTVNHGLKGNTAQLAMMQLFLVGRIEAMAALLPYIENKTVHENFVYEWRCYQDCLKNVMDALKEA